MTEILSQLDTQLFLLINSFHTPSLDRFMMLLSDRFVWVPLYAIILAITAHRFGLRGALLCALGAALAVTLADQTCATLIRPFAQRLRPSNADNPIAPLVHIVNGYRGGPYGMPSCHAANTFAVATLLSLAFRRRRIIVGSLFAWALLICYSRVYLGVHYPGDLLAGATVGTAAGAIAYLAVRHLGLLLFRRPMQTHRELIHVAFSPAGPQLSISGAGVILAAGLLTTLVLLIASLVGYFA